MSSINSKEVNYDSLSFNNGIVSHCQGIHQLQQLMAAAAGFARRWPRLRRYGFSKIGVFRLRVQEHRVLFLQGINSES